MTANIDMWVDRARRRLGVDAAVRATCQSALWLFPALALVRFGLLRVASSWAHPVVLCCCAVLGLGTAFALTYLRRPSRLASAVHLDRRLGTDGTIASALELRSSGPSGYLDLATDQAERRLLSADFPWVLALHRPKELGPSLLLLAAFLATLAIRVEPPLGPLPRPATLPAKAGSAPVLLSPEEVELLERRANRLLELATSEEGRQRARDYAELVEQLERGALDQRQALSAVAALERDVQGEHGASDEDRDGAKGKADSSKPSSPAAAERQKDSAEALRRLAERLAQETKPPTQRELDQIRETLEEARQKNQREHEAARAEEARASERLRDKERRLLAKKQGDGLTKSEEAELEKTKRQLERLDRKKKESERAESELDRQLAEAMRELAGNPGKAGEFLDRAADTRSQEEQKQLTDDEKRELLEQLRALKERLRQDEQSDMADKLRDFERRARGGKESSGAGQGQKQPGGASASVPRPSAGAGQPGSGPGSEQPGESAETGRSSSMEPGTQHDPNWQGDASERLAAKTEDKTAAARDTGEGGSESETILTAAEAGFRAGSYERLYKDYQTVLEEMVKGETIPRGRRTEVERYFELIRPRTD